MQVQVKEWGNSQGIRLAKGILQDAGIELNETQDADDSIGTLRQC